MTKMTKGKLRGRFDKETSRLMKELGSSIEEDEATVLEDIWGNRAHTIMLARQKIIDAKDAAKILSALREAESDYKKGVFILKPELEDVHMNVEDYVEKHAGKDAGGRMHTARSRNDQVLTDTRLHLREKILGIEESIIALQKAFLRTASRSSEKLMPSYTHTQLAQPITLGYWATAYVSILTRDLTRLKNAYLSVNHSPLGACAVAGTSFPIDRKMTAELLGFSSVLEHALDAVSSRDFIVETLAALSILASNLSRLSEELILYSTKEYGILEMSDEYTTGSSIMPQKKNPDAAELARGMSGQVAGNLIQVLMTLKSLPLGYNRDLQEDRALLWESIKNMELVLKVLTGVVSTARFNEKRMTELSGANFSTATELANYLVREKKMPFRRAHEVTANVVRDLHTKKKDFSDLKLTEKMLKKSGVSLSNQQLKNILDPRAVIYANRSLGGTSPREVVRMTRELSKNVSAAENSIRDRRNRITKARKLTVDSAARLT